MHVRVDIVSQMQGHKRNFSFCDNGYYSPRHASCRHYSSLLTRDGVKVDRSLLQRSKLLLQRLRGCTSCGHVFHAKRWLKVLDFQEKEVRGREVPPSVPEICNHKFQV